VRERQVGGKVASSTRETEVGFNKVGRFYHLMAADPSQVLSDLTRAAGETWKADEGVAGGHSGRSDKGVTAAGGLEGDEGEARPIQEDAPEGVSENGKSRPPP